VNSPLLPTWAEPDCAVGQHLLPPPEHPLVHTLWQASIPPALRSHRLRALPFAVLQLIPPPPLRFTAPFAQTFFSRALCPTKTTNLASCCPHRHMSQTAHTLHVSLLAACWPCASKLQANHPISTLYLCPSHMCTIALCRHHFCATYVIGIRPPRATTTTSATTALRAPSLQLSCDVLQTLWSFEPKN
jgi:hypothetical protein